MLNTWKTALSIFPAALSEMSKEIYILGGSGHALVVNEIIRLNGWKVMGYFDLQKSEVMPSEISYMGQESADKLQTLSGNAFFFPAIGNNELRSKVIRLMKETDRNQLMIVHPDSTVSPDAQIGLLTMIGPRAVVNPFARIGEGVIINSGAIIEHECVIGNFCHIAPGATLLGNVQIGDFSFIGGNAVVKQGVKIGSHVTIGAGSVVLNDIPDNSIMVGNPAKLMK